MCLVPGTGPPVRKLREGAPMNPMNGESAAGVYTGNSGAPAPLVRRDSPGWLDTGGFGRTIIGAHFSKISENP